MHFRFKYNLILLCVITSAKASRLSHGGHASSSRGKSHSYPHSSGLSGAGSGSSQTSRTVVNQHYHYSPPQQITYGSASHPVYHGQPPVYVYTYHESGSRYDSLLTGLALYNLGRMSADHHRSYDNNGYTYRGTPGEVCKLGISKQRDYYEETIIDCKLLSSFILDQSISATEHVTYSTSVVTTSTNVANALQVKGPSIAVTSGMTCYVIRILKNISTMKRPVECELLQAYTRSSLLNDVIRLKPTLYSVYLFLLWGYYILH